MLMSKLASRVDGVVAAKANVSGITAVLFDPVGVRAVRGVCNAALHGSKDPYDALVLAAENQEALCAELAEKARITVVCDGGTLADFTNAEVFTDWLIPICVFDGLNLRVGDPAIHGYGNPSCTFRPIGDPTRCVEVDMERREAVPVGLFDPAAAYLSWTGNEDKAAILGRKAQDGFWKWHGNEMALKYTAAESKSVADRLAALAGNKPTYQQRLGRFSRGRDKRW